MSCVHGPLLLDLGACPGALCHLGKTACDRLLVDIVLLLLPPRSIADLQAAAAPPAPCSQRSPIAAHMACEITRRSAARVALAAAAPASSRVADRTLNFPLSSRGRGREFLFFCSSEFVLQSVLETSPLPACGGERRGCRGGDDKAIVLLCSIWGVRHGGVSYLPLWQRVQIAPVLMGQTRAVSVGSL